MPSNLYAGRGIENERGEGNQLMAYKMFVGKQISRFAMDVKPPAAPRITIESGISMADEWCWKVAQRAYELATVRSRSTRQIVKWKKLPMWAQDAWFWRAHYVIAALDELE